MSRRPSLRAMKRRTLLRGLGGAALLSPLVVGSLSTHLRAQQGDTPLRMFLMFTGNGQSPSHWLPTGGETSFTLSPVLEPLAAHQDKLLLLHGLVGNEKGHSGGMSETTTGWTAQGGSGVPQQGPSIDQLLADAWRGDTPLSSLELGVMPANGSSDQTSYAAGGLPLPAIGSPLGALQRLADVTNLSPEEAERRRALDASVLDAVAGELASLNAKLNPEGRALLDEHLTLVRAQEEALKAPYVPLSCDLPVAPADAGLAATWTAQHDNVATAFRCGVTRVASLRAGGWGGIESGGYDEIGIGGGHHSIAHSGPDADLIGINRFHAEQLAHLITSLDAVPEGDGSLLDSTVVVWVNELGLGEFNHHSRSDCHVVIAGGRRAGLKNGAFLNLAGADWQDFLFTLVRALGVDVAQVGHHGSTMLSAMLA
jgi:Protein of unknown function (DUF1552)